MFDDSRVVEFWNWFVSNAHRIHEAYHHNEASWLAKTISPRVDRIADGLNWEIGPYHAPDDTFVLSPTVRENLSITRAAIAIAPRLDGWQFLPAKPAKQLSSLAFSAFGINVNADDWRYRLTAYSNGEFVDIEIFVNASSGLPEAHEDLFCELVVESLVGEQRRLDRIGYLKPTIVTDNTKIEKSIPIQYLADHLDQVLAPR